MSALRQAEQKREFCVKQRAITIIDDLQHYIVEHSSALAPSKMYEFAVHLLVESCDKECVKIGLSILELFDAFENLLNLLISIIREDSAYNCHRRLRYDQQREA